MQRRPWVVALVVALAAAVAVVVIAGAAVVGCALLLLPFLANTASARKLFDRRLPVASTEQAQAEKKFVRLAIVTSLEEGLARWGAVGTK